MNYITLIISIALLFIGVLFIMYADVVGKHDEYDKYTSYIRTLVLIGVVTIIGGLYYLALCVHSM